MADENIKAVLKLRDTTTGEIYDYEPTSTSGISFDDLKSALETETSERKEADEALSSRVSDIELELTYLNPTAFETEILGCEFDFVNDEATRLCKSIGLEAYPFDETTVVHDDVTGNDIYVAKSDFDEHYPYSEIRRCNLDDDGNVIAYFGEDGYTENDYTKQVMVEIPKIYYRVYPVSIKPKRDGGLGYYIEKARYYIAKEKLAGFKIHPAFVDADGNVKDHVYISAFEASMYDASLDKIFDDNVDTDSAMDYTNDRLCSVGNARIISGKTKLITRPSIETLAQARGARYHGLDHRVTALVQLLFAIEYNGFNWSKKLYSSTTGGAVDIPDTNASTNNSLNTGSTSNYTCRACTSKQLINGTQTDYTTRTQTSFAYRGIENFYGNVWKYVSGINYHCDADNGSQIPYLCTDYNYAESKGTANYESIGFSLPTSHGYYRYFGWSEKYNYMFIPTEVIDSNGASGITGDFLYQANNTSSWYIALLGGSWNLSSDAGAFYWASNNVFDSRSRKIASRLFSI